METNIEEFSAHYLREYLRAALDIQGGTPVPDAVMNLCPAPDETENPT